jgi:hemerythrin-like domain-containing protein
MKCTELLIQDHKVILRCLNVLEQMAVLVEKGDLLAEEDVAMLLRFLRAFADEHHHAKEESALFPELVLASSAQDRPLHQMLFEHDQERSLVEGLEDSLHAKKGADFAYFANRLTELLRNHIYKEDNILFDIVDRALLPQQDEKVVAEFNKFHINPSFLADLRRLEWKYLRKAA